MYPVSKFPNRSLIIFSSFDSVSEILPFVSSILLSFCHVSQLSVSSMALLFHRPRSNTHSAIVSMSKKAGRSAGMPTCRSVLNRRQLIDGHSPGGRMCFVAVNLRPRYAFRLGWIRSHACKLFVMGYSFIASGRAVIHIPLCHYWHG